MHLLQVNTDTCRPVGRVWPAVCARQEGQKMGLEGEREGRVSHCWRGRDEIREQGAGMAVLETAFGGVSVLFGRVTLEGGTDRG